MKDKSNDTPPPQSQMVATKELSPSRYRAIHDAAAAAYEASTPVDCRYSALALRKAVDAALDALASAEE